MDYIRQLGPVVLDHRLRRIMEVLLRTAEEIYAARGLDFRARWASTYQLLHGNGPLAIGELAERLRLTHPAVIGITDDMMAAGVVQAVRDNGDARRRLLTLTAKGGRMAAELFRIWGEIGRAQRNRFLAAGCDVIPVLNQVEDDLHANSLATEILNRLEEPQRTRGTKSAKRAGATRRHVARIATVLLLGMSGAQQSRAQSTAPSPARSTANAGTSYLDRATKEAIVKALGDTLVAGYIYEVTARKLADSVRAELRAGAYDSVRDGEAFATRLTQTLRRISNDRHLGVRFGARGAAATPVIRRVRPMTTPSTGNTPPRAVAGGPQPRRPDAATREALVALGGGAEYGFARAEILPGNIGYIDLRGFSGAPDAMRVADSVMAIVTGAKALIIDLGRNTGGGPQMVQYLSAYLFDNPTHLVSTFARGMPAPMERWTSPRINGKPLSKVPVYILTSRRTFSAAESFTFGLKVNNRVTIVGERTGGGGHFGGFVQLPVGFTAFIPRGRTYDPRTNKGWEAEGLEPDVEVQYEDALATALSLARR